MKLNLTKPINEEEKKVYRFNVFRKMADGSLRKVTDNLGRDEVLETTASSYDEAFNWAEHRWAEKMGTGKTPGLRRISMRGGYEIHPEGVSLFGPQPVPKSKPKLGYDPLAMFRR